MEFDFVRAARPEEPPMVCEHHPQRSDVQMCIDCPGIVVHCPECVGNHTTVPYDPTIYYPPKPWVDCDWARAY